MAKQQIETVRELIYLSYSNLAMAHTAVDKKQEKYGAFNYMIRARLFKGLKTGTMNMRTIFDDEKIKRMDEFQRSILTINDNKTLFETDLQLL